MENSYAMFPSLFFRSFTSFCYLYVCDTASHHIHHKYTHDRWSSLFPVYRRKIKDIPLFRMMFLSTSQWWFDGASCSLNRYPFLSPLFKWHSYQHSDHIWFSLLSVTGATSGSLFFVSHSQYSTWCKKEHLQTVSCDVHLFFLSPLALFITARCIISATFFSSYSFPWMLFFLVILNVLIPLKCLMRWYFHRSYNQQILSSPCLP